MINIESLPPAARKSDPLDGMRGLAVLIVFLSHTSGRDMALAPWFSFHGIGHVGVYLFFVLSAFLLTKGLLGGVAVWQFYLRRFFRIAPLYYLVLVGVLIFQRLGFYTPQYLHIEEGQIMAHFLFYRGDGVFWTIAAEYAFYLLLPPIVWAIGRFGSKWLVFFAVGYFLWFLAILMGISITPLKFVDIGYHRSQYLDVFICGVLVVYVSKRLPYKLVAALFWGLILATVILVSANFLGAEQPLYKIRWLSLVYGVIFALGVISTEQGNPYFTKILRLPLLVFVGQMAFGWYLLHLAVFSVVNQYGPPSGVLRLLISTLLCAGVAYLALRIIEKPGIKLGRWIETRVIHRRSVQPGSGGLVAKAKNDG